MRAPFRADRLILAAVGLLLVAAYTAYYGLRHAQELNLNLEADRVLLTILAIIMALLVIALLFLLLRNLIKLLVERRRHVLGSRFRTKLVFIFVVLVFLPCVVLFYAAVDLIQRVNESLYAEPLERISADSRQVVDGYNQLMRQHCAGFAAQIATEIGERRLLEPGRAADLQARTRAWLADGGLDFLAFYARGEATPSFGLVRRTEPGAKAAPDDELTAIGGAPPGKSAAGETPPNRIRFKDLARQTIESGERRDRLDRLGAWQRVCAVAPVRSGSPFGDFAGALVVGRYIAPETAAKTDGIDRAIMRYRQSVKNRPNIKRISILLFAILTLLVLFAATWTGFYLARQITVPIQALAEGTQAITSGNLDHRVVAEAGDEIGFLIESFNRMTGELRSSREAVETSRRQLESSYLQLEERREYIEQLLENVPAAVISMDSRGFVTTMNRAAYRILGLDPSRPAPSMQASEVLRHEELAPLLAEIRRLPAGESPSRIQEFELSIDGRPVHLAANLSARCDAEGRFQWALLVLEDLTPLIRAQRTAAWQEVARRMAHEVKNPLTPIQLSAQRILKKFQEGAEEFPRIVQEGVTTIVREVATLKSLVDEFSRFAQMPAVSPVPADANAVIDSALSLYDGIHPAIVFVKDLEPKSPLVPLDAGQMKRALINLIDNAIAAMEGKGRVTLKTRSIPAERCLRIEIADDGPGIEPENKERLFVPYFSTKKRGTGLGLAIVNRIVSDHNGFIRVEDNRPRGTRFVIDLPLA